MSAAIYRKLKDNQTMDKVIEITTALAGDNERYAALVGVAPLPVCATTGATMQVDALAARFDKLATDVGKLKASTASHGGIPKKKTTERQHHARTGTAKFSLGRPGASTSQKRLARAGWGHCVSVAAGRAIAEPLVEHSTIRMAHRFVATAMATTKMLATTIVRE